MQPLRSTNAQPNVQIQPKPEAEECAKLTFFYYQENNEAHSLAYCRRAIQLDPDNPEIIPAYLARARIYKGQKKFEKSLADLIKAQSFFDAISPLQQEIVTREMTEIQSIQDIQNVSPTYYSVLRALSLQGVFEILDDELKNLTAQQVYKKFKEFEIPLDKNLIKGIFDPIPPSLYEQLEVKFNLILDR